MWADKAKIRAILERSDVGDPADALRASDNANRSAPRHTAAILGPIV